MYLRIFLSIWLFGFSSMLFAQSPEARLSGPRQAMAGISTGITLEIFSSGISGPARFWQVLPKGWTAKVHPQKKDYLSFSGDTLRYAWFSFPSKDSLSLYFEISIPENETGSHFLEGRIEYFSGNKLQYIDVAPHEIKLVPYYRRGQ